MEPKSTKWIIDSSVQDCYNCWFIPLGLKFVQQTKLNANMDTTIKYNFQVRELELLE